MYVLHIVQYVNICLSSSLSIPYEGGNQSPCSQSKHGCLRPRKKTKSLVVLFEISVKVMLVQMLFHSEAPGLTSPRYEIFFTVIQLNMQVYLSLWRRQTKSSPISAKFFYSLLLTIRWVQNYWNFCNIFIRSKDMQNFRFSVFLTVHVYLKTYFYENYTAKSTFYAEFRSVGIFEIYFTVQKI